jgi:hypothetical protein
MKQNSWVRLLTYITGLVNQEPLLQNEYLAAENRILRAQLPVLLRLSDLERTTLAERETARAQGSGSSSQPGQTRHHSGVVPKAHCTEV